MTKASRSSLTLLISCMGSGAFCVKFCRDWMRSRKPRGAGWMLVLRRQCQGARHNGATTTKASRANRECRHVSHQERRTDAVSTGRHLDADRDQLCRISIPDQFEPRGGGTVRADLRVGPGPLLRGIAEQSRGLSAVSDKYVHAWRLAAPYRQHVDAVAVRSHSGRPAWPWTLSRLLPGLRILRFVGTRRL